MTLGANYDLPGRVRSIQYARGHFLDTVNRLEPAVLRDLQGQPYKAFLASGVSVDSGGLYMQDVNTTEVKQDIEAWMTRWNLSAPWVYQSACLTLKVLSRGIDEGRFIRVGFRAPAVVPGIFRDSGMFAEGLGSVDILTS